MYCQECGTRLDENTRFCPQCGTAIDGHTDVIENNTITENSSILGKDQTEKNDYVLSCILFTNTNLLADSLSANREDIIKILTQFINIQKESGRLYHLVDAGNYTYKKQGLFGIGNSVSLTRDNTLWEHTDILLDFHNKEKASKSMESQYLFIIGGDDVIPMPCVKHYIPDNGHDETIDSDILYAYPYGKEMLPLLESKEIFKYDQLFHVGRLPFGEDASFQDLCNYLQRDINCSLGITMSSAYGQCDPNWKNVSANIAEKLIIGDFLPNYDGRISPEFYFNRLMLSPKVVSNNVEQVFNQSASLYYYNLHGGSAMNSRGYFGAERGGKYTFEVLTPEHMTTCKSPNVVVCEACYGARFIGFDKQHSMMLSSIHTNTMTFLGSSRVAWGGVDRQGTTPENAHICNADIIAKAFIMALLEGYSTGLALFLARSAVMQIQNPADPCGAATIIEFNLYGDPTLFLAGEEKALKGETNFNKKEKQIVNKEADLACEVHSIDSNNASILERVRASVDSNLEQIHSKINKLLYDEFGIEPRQPVSIHKMKYGNGTEEIAFKYKATEREKGEEVPSYYMVMTSSKGEIVNIYASK